MRGGYPSRITEVWCTIVNQSREKVQDYERGLRLKSERERLNFTIVEFAKKCNISKGSQINYEKGLPPTADYIAAIGQIGADMVYVLVGVRSYDVEPRAGTSVRTLDGRTIAVHGARKVSAPLDSGLVQLPRLDIDAAAGTGIAVQGEQQLGVVAFDRKFLRDHGGSPDHCKMIRARGDSMVPTFPDGALLVVDLSQQDIAHGCITVIGIHDDLLVKRVRRRLDGAVELVSDNSAYPPEIIDPDRLDQLRVVGRVIYFCRTP